MLELLLVSWLNVAQRWEPYNLDRSQRKWIESLHSMRTGNAISCCDLSDGYPTEAQLKIDGWYVPSISNPSIWVKVPENAVIKTRNPIGVAIVWWGWWDTNQPTIQCFVPTAEQ